MGIIIYTTIAVLPKKRNNFKHGYGKNDKRRNSIFKAAENKTLNTRDGKGHLIKKSSGSMNFDN
jgi:hypothetical protein